jgi:hypothetical protein
LQITEPSGTSKRMRWADMTAVIKSGLLGKLRHVKSYICCIVFDLFHIL